MEPRFLDVMLTVVVLVGGMWVLLAAGVATFVDFPWDLLEFTLAAVGTAFGAGAWLSARDGNVPRSNRFLLAFITLFLTWAAWIPSTELDFV